MTMFINYFKTTIRNILKYKVYSSINIGGLAVGLACCILIFLYVSFELSFDRYHGNADRIYRLIVASAQDLSNVVAVTPAGYAAHLPEEYPEIETAVRVFDMPATMIYGTNVHTLQDFAYVDPSLFQVFDFPLLQGDSKTVLEAPGSLVISEDAAISIFGEADAMGQSVTLILENQKHDFQITGIMKNIPRNSHMRFDYFVPFVTITAFRGEDALENFTSSNYFTYVMLRENVSPRQLEAKFPEFLEKYKGEATARQRVMLLQPLLDIHLNTGITFDRAVTTSKQNLTIFSFIAVFVLLIACINFMNLSTARATLRANEVGVRKVVGAKRMQLIHQFFFESILASLIAIIFALMLLNLFTPKVSLLLGRDVRLVFSSAGHVLALVGIGLFTGVLAGSYPALVLSMFRPISVMKGLSHRGIKGSLFRKVLIVLQFGITVFMLIAMGTVYNQLTYVKNRDLGFNKERVVRVHLTKNVKDRFSAFRRDLLSNPNILNMTMVRGFPGYVNMKRGYNWPGNYGDQEEKGRSLYTMMVDPHTIETLGLEIVAGRNFSDEIPSDAIHAYILNETAVRELDLENPVGQPFRAWSEGMGQIVGVVKDFHFKSLHQEIEPLVLDIHPEWCWTALIRISPYDIPETLALVETEWRRFEPEMPYSYRFLDEMFDRLYRTEERLGQLFGYFTFLALLVACLGIFGLVAFIADRRKKEIGIRKVLGASVPQLLVLMSKDFCFLVLIAFCISAPIATLFMNRWLQNFAYHMNPDLVMILLVGLFAQIMTLVTISFQSVKASLANPVDSLKYE